MTRCPTPRKNLRTDFANCHPSQVTALVLFAAFAGRPLEPGGRKKWRKNHVGEPWDVVPRIAVS
jgi:hypothetical protein